MLKLQQGQLWKAGEDFLRIVELHRLEVKYKLLKAPGSPDGTHHHVTKKEFCRLIKNATLVPSVPGGMEADSAGIAARID